MNYFVEIAHSHVVDLDPIEIFLDNKKIADIEVHIWD